MRESITILQSRSNFEILGDSQNPENDSLNMEFMRKYGQTMHCRTGKKVMLRLINSSKITKCPLFTSSSPNQGIFT